jgi:hypothetical protein
MVVVFCARRPAFWASLAMHARPEKKLADALAGNQSFEPEVAV